MGSPRNFDQACSIDRCEKIEQLRRGMCHMHYERWRLHGIAEQLPPRKCSNEAIRFLSKVIQREPGGCWEWLGSKTHNGYPRFFLSNPKRTVRAHRYSYELFIGPIPPNYEIDHVKSKGCIRRDCVNPSHLEPVTRKENAQRIYQ